MTNKEVSKTYQQLLQMYDSGIDKFPVKVAYAITRNKRLLAPIYDDYWDLRDSYIKEHADPSVDQPGLFNIRAGEEDILNQKLNELESIDNEINLSKIPFEDLYNMSLSLKDMDTLYFMIEEPGEN